MSNGASATPAPGQTPGGQSGAGGDGGNPPGGQTLPPAGGTGEATKWTDALPEAIRGHEAFQGHDTLDAFANHHIETLGRIPKVPDKPDAYQVKLPDGIVAHDGFFQAMRLGAHKAGLSNEQLQSLSDGYHEFLSNEIREGNRIIEEEVGKLKTEWGQNWEKNTELSNRAIMHFGGQELVDHLKARGLSNDPVLARVFLKIGSQISESEFVGGAPGAGDSRPKDSSGRPMLKFKGMPG